MGSLEGLEVGRREGRNDGDFVLEDGCLVGFANKLKGAAVALDFEGAAEGCPVG